PIRGGVRVSGKAGRTGIGFLTMQTDEVPGVAEGNNYSVIRMSRELPRRSSFGWIATNRQGTGDHLLQNEYNRSIGLDGRLGIGRYGNVSGFVAKTYSPDRDDKDHSFRIGSDYRSEGWFLGMNYTEVREDFNPEMGFLRRTAYRKADGVIFYRYRPDNFLGLQEVRPHISYRGFWDFDGFQETGFVHIDNHWEWKNGHEIHTGINFTKEGVKEKFEIFPGFDMTPGIEVMPGTYDNREFQFVAFTNQGAPLSFRLRSTIGGFFGGDRVSLSPSLTWRVGKTFNGSVAWTWNDIDLPEGDFITNLGRLRVSYSFTPKVFLQLLAQYNDKADHWSTNLRFGWLQTANIGLFVVYNEVRGFDASDLERPARTFIVKLSRQFDLLR
ncbi:MAG: hypothetical protein O7A63_11080, partial [Acidobacteria bacterium]|nr:hypothetical protein [Acidobacteriota bacterium]